MPLAMAASAILISGDPARPFCWSRVAHPARSTSNAVIASRFMASLLLRQYLEDVHDCRAAHDEEHARQDEHDHWYSEQGRQTARPCFESGQGFLPHRLRQGAQGL